MHAPPEATQASSSIAADLAGLSPEYAATPLLDLPGLAARLGVQQVLAKDEGRRMLGSFKSLGGTYAGLRALARAAGTDIRGVIATRPEGQPVLVCASDGNHGLAVAAAARFAGASARVYLHSGVPQSRARRIEAEGAEVVWVQGTYDDAVDAAAEAARAGVGLLVADTTDDPNDPVVRDVMAGYGVMAEEIRAQVEATGHPRPTHLFVQAGVGGLAAAMAEGLGDWLAASGQIIVVEPESAPAVAAALAAGNVVRVEGDLETTAEMLSCGEASAPALEVLRRHRVEAVSVPESILDEAPAVLWDCGGPTTTSSGAASLAGALAIHEQGPGLPRDARILILITERDVEAAG
ncbi:Putative diaminopropionate ammonia-lyase (plasmid) [Roseomonas mucosa]|uniref:pyridoxal-phosphate dependent enzyme n=1 Tax=Roseomonas mucosa TaxID=207340 RepID=UPI0021FA55C2|nr:pyridoxal-phosphate dependent enzyme [Roseomonas mucosa]QDJ12205.1 Putative diaminopropionate ammonia-lyase [Roseomonas mucosa]